MRMRVRRSYGGGRVSAGVKERADGSVSEEAEQGAKEPRTSAYLISHALSKRKSSSEVIFSR